MRRLKIDKAVLVYQGGIANVFAVSSFNLSDYGRDARRLLQGAFHTCEAFAAGLAAAGVKVGSVGCNMAGDVARAGWTTDLDSQPFSDKFRPVFSGVENTDNRDSQGRAVDHG